MSTSSLTMTSESEYSLLQDADWLEAWAASLEARRGSSHFTIELRERIAHMRSVAAEKVELEQEVKRLSRWKAEALPLLMAWSDLADEAFKLLGEPPRLLGKSGVDIVREVVNTQWVQGVVQEMIAEDAQDDGTYCEVCGFTYAPDESCWKH